MVAFYRYLWRSSSYYVTYRELSGYQSSADESGEEFESGISIRMVRIEG
jgi:hypothetical protein